MSTSPNIRDHTHADASAAGQKLPHGPGSDASTGCHESLSRLQSGRNLAEVIAYLCDWDGSSSRRSIFRRRDESALHEDIRVGERNRIAQQIHDDLGGVLTGLKACVSVAIDRRSREGFAPDPLLTDALALAELAFGTVRRIAVNLRPIILEQMDVWRALEWLVAQLARRTHLHIDYSIDPTLTSIPFGEERGLLVFRVICEALTNVEKHAQASRVSVRLFEAGGSLTVTVSDNGIGMNHNSPPKKRTLGILGMKERARAFEGEVAVTSEGDIGTTVRLTVPLERNDGV